MRPASFSLCKRNNNCSPAQQKQVAGLNSEVRSSCFREFMACGPAILLG